MVNLIVRLALWRLITGTNIEPLNAAEFRQQWQMLAAWMTLLEGARSLIFHGTRSLLAFHLACLRKFRDIVTPAAVHGALRDQLSLSYHDNPLSARCYNPLDKNILNRP